MHIKSFTNVSLLAIVATTGSLAYGFDFSFGKAGSVPFGPLQSDGVQIEIHPFGAEGILKVGELRSQALGKNATSGFALMRRGVTDLDGLVSSLAREALISPVVQMRAADLFQGTSPRGLGLANGIERAVTSREYRFYVRDIPICHYSVRAHLLSNQETLIMGRIPNIDSTEPPPVSDWPAAEDSVRQGLLALQQNDATVDQGRVLRHERCYNVASGEIQPMWDVIVEVNGLPYQLVGDAYETVLVQPAYFDVAGKVQSYERNPKQSSLKTFTIELVGDSTLRSANFETVMANGKPRTTSANHEFMLSPQDPNFAEAAVFAHVNEQFNFMKTLGYEWVGAAPMQLEIHQTFSGKVNNALFRPAESTETGKPTISVGDGDGKMLTGLPLDSDVVAHEFGHHVVFRTLKSTSGESLILHEGLADFFAYSRTGDDCLGESICPSGSQACWVVNQCLRTANNDLTYTGENYNNLTQAHLKSQLVSGLLWDLRKTGKVSAEDTTQLVHKAVDFLQQKSSLNDLVIALVTADKEYFQGKYGQTILEAANARGFTDITSRIDLAAGSIPPMTGGSLGEGTNVTPGGGTSSRSSKKSDEWCGVVPASANQNGGSLWGSILAILTPILAIVFGGVLRPVPVRARGDNRRTKR